jgi:hypothetical protein
MLGWLVGQAFQLRSWMEVLMFQGLSRQMILSSQQRRCAGCRRLERCLRSRLQPSVEEGFRMGGWLPQPSVERNPEPECRPRSECRSGGLSCMAIHGLAQECSGIFTPKRRHWELQVFLREWLNREPCALALLSILMQDWAGNWDTKAAMGALKKQELPAPKTGLAHEWLNA